MRDYRFGNFLHELRERRGLSQYQLGMLVGVSDKAVSKWENGSAKPQSRILHQLSDVLGVTVDELLSCQYRSTEDGNQKGVFAMKNQLWKDAHQALRNRYGKVLPVEILNRYLSEFAQWQETDLIVYLDLLSRIKAMANHCGEHIRIKGGIGSSFIAFVLGVTEINPLKPHYFCPHCHQIEWDKTALCGWDLPAKRCACGSAYLTDGHNLPFETLQHSLHRNVHLDLSVSHRFYRTVRETIGAYFDGSTVIHLRRNGHPNLETIVVIHEELSDLIDGQELPFEDYYDRFKPYAMITLMVNDDLDTFRCLEEETGITFQDVDFACPRVLEAFRKGMTEGIPEFRSDFFKDMVHEISPKTFYDLIQIAGLSHGTGVWFENAQALLQDGRSVREVIAYCDDVFHCVQEKMGAKGIANTGYAYKIMQDTRRGVYAKGGVSDEMKQQFSSLGIEAWFAESIGKIRYCFPRAHGVLYVQYELILMWYKLNYPEIFAKLFQE